MCGNVLEEHLGRVFQRELAVALDVLQSNRLLQLPLRLYVHRVGLQASTLHENIRDITNKHVLTPQCDHSTQG